MNQSNLKPVAVARSKVWEVVIKSRGKTPPEPAARTKPSTRP